MFNAQKIFMKIKFSLYLCALASHLSRHDRISFFKKGA